MVVDKLARVVPGRTEAALRILVGDAWLILISVLSAFFPPLTVAQVRQSIEYNRNQVAFGVKAGDPFDVETGIYYRTYLDLFIDDSIPIRFERTQRNQDTRSRSFGIGARTSYDMFIIGDVNKFSWVALVLADGGQIRYARISPGTSYSDGVFEHQATPGKFLGSRISWNLWHGNWTVALKDGTQFIVQGCNANSKPGQCAVTEMRNKAGERLTIKRDGDGNILRITSPHGFFVSVTNDSAGRITRVEDDAKRWVSYEYSPAGALARSRNWRGDTQDFRYDAQFNMARVDESGRNVQGPYRFTIINAFDKQNRFAAQTMDSGGFTSAEYITNESGKSIQVNVGSAEGLSRYFFSESGYEARQEFTPIKGWGWKYELTRDQASNAPTTLTVHCHTQTITLPIQPGVSLGDNGGDRLASISAACKKAESKASPNSTSKSRTRSQ
jgi:YD repeat-containing protein